MATERQKAIARALTLTIPRAPFLDAEAIRGAARSRHMRSLSPQVALWLSVVAHIRHAHTEYDALMDDGYDKDAARWFVLDEINAVLDRWGATRRLDPEADDSEPLAPGEEDDGEEGESDEDDQDEEPD